ncbi:MAG: hypothetical protein JW932_15040 [Deltaproteobacteria bacterium]|nr:hypothetical protein [Deltaproteobacteria bacterium]
MNADHANPEYEVMSPWAEADPIPLKGITSRLTVLENKTIGLFHNSKRAARPILSVVETKLKERYPSMNFSSFLLMPNAGVDETEDRERFDEWVKEVDAVILAYGD